MTVNGKSWPCEELFTKYFVNVNVIRNFKKRDMQPFEIDTKSKKLFVVDVSLDWATGRRWQTKRLNTWKVTQKHLLRQESVTILFLMLRFPSSGFGWPKSC